MIRKLVAFITVLVLAYVSVTAFLPIIAKLVTYGEQKGTFNSTLAPSFYPEGIYWSFELFILGLVSIIGLWAVISVLTKLGVGQKR